MRRRYQLQSDSLICLVLYLLLTPASFFPDIFKAYSPDLFAREFFMSEWKTLEKYLKKGASFGSRMVVCADGKNVQPESTEDKSLETGTLRKCGGCRG